MLGGGTFHTHKQWDPGSLLALYMERHSFLGVSPEPALAADASLQLSVYTRPWCCCWAGLDLQHGAQGPSRAPISRPVGLDPGLPTWTPERSDLDTGPGQPPASRPASIRRIRDQQHSHSHRISI